MNVGIGNKAAQFHYWEHLLQIFDTVPLQCVHRIYAYEEAKDTESCLDVYYADKLRRRKICKSCISIFACLHAPCSNLWPSGRTANTEIMQWSHQYFNTPGMMRWCAQ